ncbi:MAG: biotin/lipoyl-binding protein, partial [Planctomycetes bacterium]|nr:biotin/lipoyl-binding protein [Planctomycetota bacterium]
MNELVQAEKVQADIEAVLGLGKKTSRLRRLRTPILILALAAAGAGAYIVWGANGSQNAVRYVTEPVARGDLTVTVTATGTVQPTNQVEISSELSGIVRTVLVDYNSPVTLGQTLATLDTDKLKASADSSRARLTVAKAKVREAEANLIESMLQFERIQKLVEKKVSSGQQLEAADA